MILSLKEEIFYTTNYQKSVIGIELSTISIELSVTFKDFLI